MSKKIISLFLSLILVLGSTVAFAVDFDLKNKETGTVTPLDDVLLNDDLLLEVAFDKENYTVEFGGKLYNLAEVQAKFDADPTLTMEEAVENLIPVGEEEEDDLKVIEISAINATEIKVEFSNGEVVNFTVEPPLTEGENTVEFEHNGQIFTEVVNFTPAEEPEVKAAVENIELVNYRQLKVTYNKVVDPISAVDPQNYYFEIVEGKAGKLGAEVKDNYSLKDIQGLPTGWWDAANKNIVADSTSGKTIVTINLPHTARVGEAHKAEWILNLVKDGTIGTEKVLTKDSTVYVAVRDVKTAGEKKARAIDTAVLPVLIQDKVAPKLISDHSEVVEIKDLTKDTIIEFVFDEPIKETSDSSKLPFEAKLAINGKKDITITETDLYIDLYIDIDNNSETVTSYADGKVVNLKVTKALLEKVKDEIKVGDEFTLAITGMTDLAGNVLPGAAVAKVKIGQTTTKPEDPEVDPVIKDVKQVYDNVFRIEGNKAGIKSKLTIIDLDENGKEKFVTVEDTLGTVKYTINDVDRYFSYVAVDANYNKYEADKLNFIGQNKIIRNIHVSDVKDTSDKTGLDKILEKQNIVIDTHLPELDHDDKVVVEHTGNTLEIGFIDTFPTNWATDNPAEEVPVNAADNKVVISELQENIFPDLAENVVETVANPYEGIIRIKVEYEDKDTNSFVYIEDVKVKVVNGAWESYIKKDGVFDEVTNVGAVSVDDEQTLVIDLKKLTDTKLLNASSKLHQGGIYTVSIPEGLISDDYKAVATVCTPVDERNRVANEHGYTNLAGTAIITVDKEAESDDKNIIDNKVPQTSKPLISYDKDNNEIVVGITGMPTKASATDPNNYLINGKALPADTKIEFMNADKLEGTNLDVNYVVKFVVPNETVSETGPINFTVKDIAHKDGGKMTQVDTVLYEIKDNTAPKVEKAEIRGTNEIWIKVDEPLATLKEIKPEEAALNFKIVINGKDYVATSAVVEGQWYIKLLAPVTINDTDTVTVEVVEHNGKIAITDIAGNALKVQEIPVK